MDNPSRRQMLRALRPHGADHDDPDARAALAAAAADPALGAWFAREQAFDRAFSEKLTAAEPPPGLRRAIFAAVEADAVPSPRRPAQARRYATLAAALAMAASFALLLIVAWPKARATTDLPGLIAAAATHGTPERLNLAGRPLDEIRAWLAERAAPRPTTLPAGLAALPTDGAAIVSLEGVTGSLVVFHAPSSPGNLTGEPLRLFTVPRRSCSTGGIPTTPTVRIEAGRSLAVWRDTLSIYILAADTPPAALERLLTSAPVAHRHALLYSGIHVARAGP